MAAERLKRYATTPAQRRLLREIPIRVHGNETLTRTIPYFCTCESLEQILALDKTRRSNLENELHKIRDRITREINAQIEADESATLKQSSLSELNALYHMRQHGHLNPQTLTLTAEDAHSEVFILDQQAHNLLES